MTALYNCRHDGDQYRISKFDTDLNVESSYLCTLAECECPAGSRPTCRHRQMLPRFIQREAVNTNWFHVYESNEWIGLSPDTNGDSVDLSPDAVSNDPDPLNLSPKAKSEAPTRPAWRRGM